MRAFISALILLLAASASAQNCARTSTGYPPINDLGSGTYRGYQGGLYPEGSNTLPKLHLDAGLARSRSVVPLDTNGMPDPVNGRIVLISLGMSNTTQESQAFKSMLDTFQLRNPKLLFIDCAQGGQDVTAILPESAPFWTNMLQKLRAAGSSAGQVQIVWLKEAQANPRDSVFPHHADTLIRYLTSILETVHRKLPNASMCYLSSRIYAGYATGSLNPEPYAYQSGWALKWLIERQINGDTSLAFTGATAKVPWLAWGAYLWADGTTPRSDGLTWVCPDDYATDGTHPSNAGRRKVARLLLDFFSRDTTSASWFLAPGISSVEATASTGRIHLDGTELVINPLSANESTLMIEFFDLSGRRVLKSIVPQGTQTIRVDVSPLVRGVYFYRIASGRSVLRNKLAIP